MDNRRNRVFKNKIIMLPFFKKRKKECGLLPHKRTNIYGVGQSMQFTPWPITTFGVKKYWQESMGEGIKIAVLDTGCDYNHEDIKSNIIDGWNTIANNDECMDDNGHGTHVAGTIAASNNTLGVVGVAPKAKIMPIKVLAGDGQGSNLDVARGIIWAVDHDADIITMSLGSPYPSKPLEDAILYAKQNRVIILCAAGNSGNNHDIMYPAKYTDTISIGAIDKNLNVCAFSCTGDSLDFVAPGEDIPSCVNNGQYAIMSGTSMANPYAVGCLAILMSYRNKIGQPVRLHRDEYISILAGRTRHISDAQYIGNRNYEGYGIIQPVTK